MSRCRDFSIRLTPRSHLLGCRAYHCTEINQKSNAMQTSKAIFQEQSSHTLQSSFKCKIQSHQTNQTKSLISVAIHLPDGFGLVEHSIGTNKQNISSIWYLPRCDAPSKQIYLGFTTTEQFIKPITQNTDFIVHTQSIESKAMPKKQHQRR